MSTTSTLLKPIYDEVYYTGKYNVSLSYNVNLSYVDLSRFISQYSRYCKDTYAIRDFLLRYTSINEAIHIIETVMNEVEAGIRKGELRGTEMRVSRDLEEQDDVSLEIAVYVDRYDEHASRLWDRLCDIAIEAAGRVSRYDLLSRIYVVMEIIRGERR